MADGYELTEKEAISKEKFINRKSGSLKKDSETQDKRWDPELCFLNTTRSREWTFKYCRHRPLHKQTPNMQGF
jgi:hypothetical protein